MKPGFIVLILVALVAVLAAIRFGLKYKIRSTDPAMEDRIADNVQRASLASPIEFVVDGGAR